ncbi:MAG: ubiquinone/menaquinone biosynthesis C-methylase UbiE [Candidatus Poriferisodalaceae bacterium]|jgi:ubiquinone/menaquinone biosynthesis C-methylase UbiE/DNA-binding transcriptional ArsR family regulator
MELDEPASVGDLLEQLKAIAEATRLRILAALESCELTVSEICDVLGQTQPRVSRHLRLLSDAGLLKRHAEGTSAYYGIQRDSNLLEALVPLIDRTSPVLQRDQDRLDTVRRLRANRAAEYFAQVAEEWDQLREVHAPTSEVEAAMLAAVPTPFVDSVLDIGTGTGRILEVFADRTAQGLGVDRSRQMLSVARARLDADHLSHCSVRHSDIYNLDVPDRSQDVVILHHVLHFLSNPASALDVANQLLAPNGTLLVVDFSAHELERLRTDHAHSHLGFSDAEVAQWCTGLGLGPVAIQQFPPPPNSGDNALTVTLWTATKPMNSELPPRELEAAR